MEEELQRNFDPIRYQGLWYDVARFPKFFDRDTPWQTAYYTLKTDNDGKYIEVHNTAYNRDGSVKKEITGTARAVDPKQPAALYVSFPNIFALLFGDPSTANYLVHETDYETYAIVGSYDRNSLYLLARQRPISIELYKKLLYRVAALEYSIIQLQEDFGAIDRGRGSQALIQSNHDEDEDDETCIIG